MADAALSKPRLLSKEVHPLKPISATVKPKSLSNHFLCKLILFVLFMVAIPLFPAQAPSFINQTLAGKCWEPVRILFIGLAVSCGCSIFYGRNADSDSIHVASVDEVHSSFVSRLFHVCPVFEDGYRNAFTVNDKVAYSKEIYLRNGNFADKDYVDKEIVRSEICDSAMESSLIDDKLFGIPNRSLASVAANSVIHRSLHNSTFIERSFDAAEIDGRTNDTSSFAVDEGRNGVDKNSMQFYALRADGNPPKSQFSRSMDANSEGAGRGEGEEDGKSKSFRASYPPSQFPLKSINVEAPLNAFHLRRYSSGSLFKKDPVKDFTSHATLEQPEVTSGKSRMPDSDPMANKNSNKSTSGGKSVRTLRSSKHSADTSDFGDSLNEPGEVDDGKNVATLADGMGARGSDEEHQPAKPMYREHRKKEKGDPKVEAKELPNYPEKNRVPVAAKEPINCLSDAGYESGEVDRKAEEFIAKFKEQIRLQKEASIDRSRGARISSSHFR